ncbi:MAG: M23 family metallopeptidase [Sporomusaceae bacterium]|nr:M23 family metallopeptidase [Sporomusaceae bacterium]
MAILRPGLGCLRQLWDRAAFWRRKEPKNPKGPDKREYTLMIVPHQGESVIRVRIPILAVKASLVGMCVLAVAGAGFAVTYRNTLNVASAEKTELVRLRQETGHQSDQLEQLAQKTAALQNDVSRLNVLDAEIRRLVDGGDSEPVSRSGASRARYGGQGGEIVNPNAEQLNTLVEELQAVVKVRERSLAELKEKVADRNARLAVTPSIWPANGDVTSRFGWRSSPFGWGSDWHPGIDIANSPGTPIAATADGQVVMSGWYGGYGKCVQIDHGNGIISLYGHNSELLVSVGQTIKKGDLIAYMGSTGASTGSHVHYEIRVNGTAVNPANFL